MRPAVLCLAGHTPQGKVSPGQQILAANLARRGFVALATDPVGQGERSQFWDPAKGSAPFGLACGEHAVLGNPLYLLGASLARYEIWDAMRAIDLLAGRDDVDPARIGCVGGSGGGTQTAYVAALDPRVAAAAVVCYITTLPRRMANRIAADPDSDPEQDLLGFVSAGVDHAGLLALIAPCPLLLGTAEFDFFPIEGARQTHLEAARLYAACDQAERIKRVEVPEKHSFNRPLREATYAFFERWLMDGKGEAVAEVAEAARPASDLLVGPRGQVSLDFHSRPLLELAWQQLGRKPPASPRPLREILKLDLDQADPKLEAVVPLVGPGSRLVLCVAGNESGNWRDERGLLSAIAKTGAAVDILEPRLVGRRRSRQTISGHEYADLLCGVEANLAYNAFLVGQSLVGLRVADVLAATDKLVGGEDPPPIVLCGRRDAALVCLLAAAIDRRIAGVAVEECLASFAALFQIGGRPINAASIVPDLLRDYGDVGDLVRQIGPNRVLFAAPIAATAAHPAPPGPSERFTQRPEILVDWLARQA